MNSLDSWASFSNFTYVKVLKYLQIVEKEALERSQQNSTNMYNDAYEVDSNYE